MIDLVQGKETVPLKIRHLKLSIDTKKTLEESIVDFISKYTTGNNGSEVRKIIIFCQMKSEVSKINNCLNANSHKLNSKRSSMIHGDIPQKQRD
jgi:superfamily II DNA/RNA helicase